MPFRSKNAVCRELVLKLRHGLQLILGGAIHRVIGYQRVLALLVVVVVVVVAAPVVARVALSEAEVVAGALAGADVVDAVVEVTG